MFGSRILEVAIGIIFVFLLVSMICSAIREGIEGWRKSRAAFLDQGIREVLHDREAVGVARMLYTHPLIYGLFLDDYRPTISSRAPTALTRGGNLPSYIPSRNFALALLDLSARGTGAHGTASNPAAPTLTLDLARANVLNLENGAVQRVVLGAIDAAHGDVERAVANLAVWYDSAMDRVSGAYKRATQKLLFVIGLVAAVVLNLNTIAIAHHLYRDDAERAAIVARAEAAARDSAFARAGGSAQYALARASLDSLRLPIGWDDMELHVPWRTRLVRDASGVVHTVREPQPWRYVFEPIVGWLLTALAVMLGAPFWFDLLNRMMVVRSTVKPHEKSPEEGSEDRQPRTERTVVVRADDHVSALPRRDGESPSVPTDGRGRDDAAAVVPDPELDVDACDVVPDAGSRFTDDADLPATRGGVAG